MKKESKNYSLWQRFGAMVLAAVLVLGMVPVTGVSAAGNIGTVHKIEDPETLTRPQAIYGDNTLNAGKITVGKSVSKDAITVDGHQIGLIDDNNFLVTISQTAQVMGLSSETSVPVDVVFVLDMSNSMEDEVGDLVTAANNAIETLMVANEHNRVAVVGFSGGSGAGTSGGAHANVLSSLAHYTGEAATKHLQWVNSSGDLAANGGYIAGRDQATITVTTGWWPNQKQETKTVYAFRDGTSSGTNIHAGVALGGSILADVDPEHIQVNGVTRIPFLVVMSDGDPTLAAGSSNVESWYDPSLTNYLGNIVSYDGLGTLTALTAAYYKGVITEKYFGSHANENNHCFIYTMGLGLTAGGMGEMTMDPSGVTSNTYKAAFEEHWAKYESGQSFSVKVGNNSNYTITAQSIADTKKYVYGTGLGYTGSYKYNDDYFSASQGSELERIFTDLVSEISKKAITVPTKVTTGDHDFDGYVTFADPLGEYMEIKSMKGLLINGQFYQGATAAQYMASGANAEFNAMLEKVLKTRLIMTGSTATGENLLNGAKASPYQAYYNSATDFDNSIVWWGKGYRVEGEEDPGMQVLASAYNDSIDYITDPNTSIPEGATHVCRSYFFGAPGQDQSLEYLYFVVRVQRSLKAPYQQTVVISAPASLLSVEKVMIEETFDNNNNPVYTASVQKAAPARVVYEVGLWDTINEESVSTIVSETYRNEDVNGDGQVNYDPDADTYYFFTNDWDRTEDQDHHHRAMAKATFDAAADNAFYTYQKDTLLVNANGNPVTSNPRGTKVYYVREYYDWSGSRLNNGSYAATKKTKLIEVEVPSDAELIQENGKWYIPKGAYTAATLIVNGDDAEKSSNNTNTAEVVAHPHRTGDAGNSHYTVLLGNNGSISLKSNVPAPTKTVSNVTTNIVDADGKSVMVGDVLKYTVHAKNYSANTGKITITDTVPAGTVFISADNGVTPDANGKLTWVLENVAAGAEVSVSFTVKVTEAALDNQVVTSAIMNTATVRLNNSPAYDTNTVTNPPQGKKVAIQGDTTGSSVQVGDILQYFIEFHNDTGAVADQVTIVDRLPAGTDFVIADHGGVYDPATHTVTWTIRNVAAGIGGVVSFSVQVNSSAKTTIENNANIEIGDHEYTTNTTTTNLDQGSLTLKKTVVIPQGLTPAEDRFVLTLTDPTGKLTGTYSGVAFVNGVATVEIVHGQTVTIEGLPAGTTILVTENVPAGFKVAYTNNGQAVIPTDGTASVEITNTYAVSNLEVLLQGEKTLLGGSPDPERFGFTVVPSDAAGNPTGTAAATGEVTLTSGTETISFGKLTFTAPGTYHYLITEVNGGQTGVTYAENQYLVTIVVADNGKGELVQEGATRIQTRAGNSGAFTDDTGTMLFTNEYKPLSTSVTFEGTKTLIGRVLKDGEFSFVVTEDGNVVSTGSNNADGKISFRPITYSETGTHTYVISEQGGNLSGVRYDDTVYTVTVEVKDVDGQLVATVTGADGIAFENTFEPDEVTVTLEANKVLTGATLKDSQFSFVVKDENGKQVASGTNDANGKITFSKIEYFLSDLGGATSKTFTYKITEIVPDSGVDPSMYYDSLVIDVSVTVTYDPATGILTVGEPVYSADTTFNNINNPDTITVIPVGTKTTTGIDGVRFSFSVVDVDTNAVVSSGTSGVNGNITFAGITYDYEDLGGAASKTFYYWITEDQGGTTSAGITYDDAKYLMVVTIGINGTKGLTKDVQYFTVRDGGDPKVEADRTEAAVAFSNKYEVTTGTTVTMQVNKILENLDLAAGKFEFGLYHNNQLVATATNAADGTVTFTRVYPASVLAQYDDDNDGKATIAYVIKELNNNIHGITYATNEVRVEVLIEDNGQGGMKDPVVTYLDTPTFTNTYTPDHIHVNLTAQKDLTGRDLVAGEFSFVVLEGTTEVAWGTNDAAGNIVFSNLTYGFEDAGKTFTYTVKEVKPDIGADPNLYYDPSEFTVTVTVSYSETTGLLTATISDLTGVIFENVQNPATIEVKPAGTKTINNLVGADVSGLRFSFRVLGLTGTDLNTMTLGSVEATGISTGSNAIQFTNLVFDNDDVGKTFYYVIEEIAVTAVNTVTYSNAKFGMSVYVYRDSTNYNALATHVIYYNIPTEADVNKPAVWTVFGSGDRVDFVNDYHGSYATLNIEGTKEMLGNKTLMGGEFDFRLQVLDASGVPVPGAIVDGVNESDGSISFGTLIFTDNQINSNYFVETVDNQDGTVTDFYEYRAVVNELKPAVNAIPGVTYSQQQYLVVIRWAITTVTATSEVIYGQPVVTAVYEAEMNGSAVVAKSTTNLLDAKSVEDALTFTNEYEVTTGTTVTMQVNKILENLDLTAGKFEFGLYHNSQLVATATNAADGTVTFTRVYAPSVLAQYDDDNDGKATIVYVIKELNNNIHGITYATNEVRVEVLIEDNGQGGMKAPVVTYLDTPTFTNTYTPEHVHVNLEAQKELTGRDLVAGEFSFVVLEGTTEVAWGTNDAAGNVVFSNLTYGFDDAGKTFTYTVKEVKPDIGADPNLYYDPAEFTVTVTVSYSETTGLLTYDIGYPADMEFNNIQNPATVAVTPAGSKTTTGNIPADTQFSYTIIDVVTGLSVGAGTSGINGEIAFSTLIYDSADVGRTYYYWIVEDNGGTTRSGITYDDAQYLMVVTVGRNATNELTTDVAYYIVAEGGDSENEADRTEATVDFTNVYQVTQPATVTIEAEKLLTGRDLRFGEFGFNLYHVHGAEKTLIATAVNGHNGNAEAIFFSRTYAPSILKEHGDGTTATIHYVIEEQNNGLGGVNYDAAVPVYVKVVVTDLTNGTMSTEVTYYSDEACTQPITGNPAFANSYDTTDTVFKPVVDKILNGRDMVDNEFSFVITDLRGNPVGYGLSKAASSGTAGSILFNEITYTYQQYITAAERNAQGDAIFRYVISEIPGNLVNVTYTDAKIYLQVTVKDLGNGALEATGEYFSDDAFTQEITGTPAFRNAYEAIGTTVTLEAGKTLIGRAPIDGEFSFQVKDEAGNVVATGGNYGNAVAFSGIGITAAMMDGQLEKTFTFTMEELNTSQGAVTFDPNKYTAQVTVVNNQTTGKLEVTDVTYSTGNGAAPTFVNEYAPAPAEMALPIHKDLINHTLKAGMFRFEVTFEGQVVAQITNDDQGNAIFSGRYPVSVLDDVTPDANNVRSKTFVYTITEVFGTADSDDDNGTYTYDPAKYTVTVTVTDDGKGNLSTERTITKDGESAEYVVFTNSFTPDPITVDLDTAFGATKTIVDREGNVIQREDVEFSFVVTDLYGNTIATGTASGADAVDGVMPVDFGTFTFSVEGEYRYLITESTTAMDGYVLDTTVWCTHILVRYDPDTGKLSVSDADVYTHILAPEGHAEEGIQAMASENPAFVNVYDTDDVQLHLVMDKTMTGDRTTVKEHEFKFQLLTEDGIIVGEAWNHADGSIHFYLDYTLQDLLDQDSRTFRYTVKEIIPEAAELVDGGYVLNGITYDSSIYTLAVTLTDNGKGELVTTVDGDVVAGTVYTGIEFVNEYIAKDVTVPFHAIKRMEGMPLMDGIYTFYLMDGEEILSTGINRADGTIVFNKTLTYTEPGTYTYTMVEYKDTQPGVTFDETSFTVTVVVTDNGRGNLEYTIAYTTEEGNYDLPVFINIYQPADIIVSIKAHKELTGRELAEEFRFQLLDADRNVVSEVTNAVDGTVTFEAQRYTEVGTYTYTIEEVIPAGAVENVDGTYTLNGVTYDKTVYTVVVEITDPGFDGQLDKQVTYYLGTEIVEEAKVIFTNTYETADSDPVVIEGNKTLENQDLAEETFHFQLKDSQGKVLQTVTHDAQGLFSFAPITYTFADMGGKTQQVFTYTVSEVLGDLGGIIYDKTVYTVTVTVTDDGLGNLTAVAVVTGGKNDGEIRFTNVYTTNATSTDVTAKKELTGKTLEDGAFQFILVNKANQDERYTATNKADGTIVFEDLTFAVAGTYVYELSEVAGTDRHYTYDSKVITVTITVVDNGDGTLTATPSYSETAVFKNTYHPDPITVVLEGEKDLTGRDLKAEEFSFQVRDAEGRLVTTGTNRADGTLVFQPIVIDTELEMTLYVTEVKGTDKYVVYDDYTYRVKVTVTNENGVLKAEVTYLDGAVIFFNEYKPPETPPTGDDTPVHLYMAMMTFSAIALMAVLALNGKKRTRKFC